MTVRVLPYHFHRTWTPADIPWETVLIGFHPGTASTLSWCPRHLPQCPATHAMTMHRSKSKLQIQFQYGGRPFSETGSSFISATDWDISSKFGMQIHFHLFKQILLLNPYSEVDFRLYGHHLENSIWRHNYAVHCSITTKFGRRNVKWHADDITHVVIETGNRISIWQPSVFRNRK